MGAQNNRKEEMTQTPQPEVSNKFTELENERKGEKQEEEREPKFGDPPSKSRAEGKGSHDKGFHKETYPHPDQLNHSSEEEASEAKEGEIGQSQFSQKKN